MRYVSENETFAFGSLKIPRVFKGNEHAAVFKAIERLKKRHVHALHPALIDKNQKRTASGRYAEYRSRVIYKPGSVERTVETWIDHKRLAKFKAIRAKRVAWNFD